MNIDELLLTPENALEVRRKGCLGRRSGRLPGSIGASCTVQHSAAATPQQIHWIARQPVSNAQQMELIQLIGVLSACNYRPANGVCVVYEERLVEPSSADCVARFV